MTKYATNKWTSQRKENGGNNKDAQARFVELNFTS